MLQTRRLVVIVVLAAFAAACGSSGSGKTAGSGASGSAVQSGTAKITIKNFMFDPGNLTVTKGTKVTFTNDDSTTHTATSTGGSTLIHSGDLRQGQSYSVTFTKPGTYHYICSIHNYMTGTITVR